MSDFEDYMKARGVNPDLTMVCSNFSPEDMRGAFEAGRQSAPGFVTCAHSPAELGVTVSGEPQGAPAPGRETAEFRAGIAETGAEPECLASHCPPSATVDCEWPKCAPQPQAAPDRAEKAEATVTRLLSLFDKPDSRGMCFAVVTEGTLKRIADQDETETVTEGNPQ